MKNKKIIPLLTAIVILSGILLPSGCRDAGDLSDESSNSATSTVSDGVGTGTGSGNVDVSDTGNVTGSPDITRADVAEYTKLFDEFNSVLGLLYEAEEVVPEEVILLVEKRKSAKQEKDFALADKIREEIHTLGYTVEESRQGVRVKKMT